MSRSATPIAFFHQQTHRLRSHLPGVLDGRVESIHDARIATRRIREVLPLIQEQPRLQVPDDLSSRVKQMGRSLGRVRDADVRIELLRYLESRIAQAAPSLVLVRQRQERERVSLLRQLVKRLERLGVEQELARLPIDAAWQRPRFWIATNGAWRHQLRDLVAERAQAARDAVVHAGGLYFPNRAHRARIAIKQFRYAVEISALTGLLTDQPLLRTLKKAQDLLGEVHDRQTLIDELKEGRAEQTGIDARQVLLIMRVAEAEIEDRYKRVLARRHDVIEACRRAELAVQRPDMPIGWLAAAGAAVLATGLGFEARRRYKPPIRPMTPDHSASEVSVRIPVALTDRNEVVDTSNAP